MTSTEIPYQSPKLSVKLPAVSVIGKVEGKFEDTDKAILHSYDLNIDFAEVEYFDIQSIIFLLSLTYSRHSLNKKTQFTLPAKNNPKRVDILIVLHTWRFFDVLAEITGVNKIDYLLNPRSFSPILEFSTSTLENGKPVSNLKESDFFLTQSQKYFSNIYKDDEGLKTLHFDQNFFRLISKPFHNRSEKINTLRETPMRWGENSLIVSVLEKNINENKNARKSETFSIGNKLANDIIRESLTNSIRHPNANMLVTGCYFDKRAKHFTVVIWDNGKSIAQSLYEGLLENGTLRISESFAKLIQLGFNPSYFLTNGTENYNKYDEIDVNSRFMFSDDLPSKDDDFWRFLLASFYPGVSRDTEKKSRVSIIEDNIQEDHSGMGLTVLLDSVVKIFGGTVSARIDSHFISIKNIERQFLQTLFRKLKEKVFFPQQADRYKREKIDTDNLKQTDFVYQVKIVTKKDSIPFKGNMLTIKIPIG